MGLRGAKERSESSDEPRLATTADAPADGGKLIVLTAPLTEIIDHAGYFIQMGMASLPIWLENVLNRKYPHWRDVEYNEDGSARSMPAGIWVRQVCPTPSVDDIVAAYPGDPPKFIGPRSGGRGRRTTLWGNFAAGVRFGLFPEAAHQLLLQPPSFEPERQPSRPFKVLVGGSGPGRSSRPTATTTVDCVVKAAASRPTR
jgi:hypothetical protein